ncbi:hypothetical protein DQ04_12171000 [Trypanosoma grayi]|uniref:hypothetical protein n=1 Tax=Trypanosoma grayi TaxID=71804 RepID=UPI0004F48FE8|nr:hypothetical protein DQ04_12171000 [Trypanosoma grayi]KEG06799.1 hypothetical protein DQ04_12171000 [Trypanosoma grayi]
MKRSCGPSWQPRGESVETTVSSIGRSHSVRIAATAPLMRVKASERNSTAAASRAPMYSSTVARYSRRPPKRLTSSRRFGDISNQPPLRHPLEDVGAEAEVELEDAEEEEDDDDNGHILAEKQREYSSTT